MKIRLIKYTRVYPAFHYKLFGKMRVQVTCTCKRNDDDDDDESQREKI